MFARIALALSTALLTFAVVCLWSATAGAQELHMFEENCTRRAMVQGTLGESVTTCDLVVRPAVKALAKPSAKLASKPSAPSRSAMTASGKARQGHTTVVARLGKRPTMLVMAPLVVRASALRVAALDVDGTCGGLPAVCCDWQRGSRVVCGVSQF